MSRELPEQGQPQPDSAVHPDIVAQQSVSPTFLDAANMAADWASKIRHGKPFGIEQFRVTLSDKKVHTDAIITPGSNPRDHYIGFSASIKEETYLPFSLRKWLRRSPQPEYDTYGLEFYTSTREPEEGKTSSFSLLFTHNSEWIVKLHPNDFTQPEFDIDVFLQEKGISATDLEVLKRMLAQIPDLIKAVDTKAA